MEAFTFDTPRGPRRIGPGCPVFVVAELTGNHNGDYARAEALVDAAIEAPSFRDELATVLRGRGSTRAVRVSRLNGRRLKNGARITVRASMTGRLTTTARAPILMNCVARLAASLWNGI